ncbi:MAG: hypothetical protein ACFFC7_14020 [Candidatus Hermodarchaeota archaeon]
MILTVSSFPQPIKTNASEETLEYLQKLAKKGKIVRIFITACCAETTVGIFSKKYIGEEDVNIGMIGGVIPFYSAREPLEKLERLNKLKKLLIAHVEHKTTQKGLRSVKFDFKFGEKAETL